MQGMDHIGIILAAKTVEGTRLHFSGDFTWWMAAILAGVAALAAAWIYRGAIKGRVAAGLWMRWSRGAARCARRGCPGPG